MIFRFDAWDENLIAQLLKNFLPAQTKCNKGKLVNVLNVIETALK